MKRINGSSYNINGWKYISIYGAPKERGYAYGYLCATEFREIQDTLRFLMYDTYGVTWSHLVYEINQDFKEMTQRKFGELYEEMEGVAEGLRDAHCDTTVDEILAWNFYLSIPYWYGARSSSSSSSASHSHGAKEGGGNTLIGATGARDHCSSFIAVGKDWTETGEIVCAHNSFTDFIDGQFSNVVLDISPEKGHRILMQTSPAWIWSGTDFFVTSRGIIGTETTIGGFSVYKKLHPIGYRIRRAMQYGNSLDDYCEMLLHKNSGDYANSWLFGDTRTNEILRLELGLQYHNIERTTNGYFIGFNAPYDPRIRNLEVQNSGFDDVRRHQGARKVRLGELMDKYKGKLNISVAQKIISDHYDVYLQRDNHPCSRTVCSHYELDAREYMSDPSRPKPYAPHGAIDGIVCDSSLARRMSFVGKFGSSCNIPFVKKAYFAAHRQYERFSPYIKDRPSQPWTMLCADTGDPGSKQRLSYTYRPNQSHRRRQRSRSQRQRSRSQKQRSRSQRQRSQSQRQRKL